MLERARVRAIVNAVDQCFIQVEEQRPPRLFLLMVVHCGRLLEAGELLLTLGEVVDRFA